MTTHPGGRRAKKDQSGPTRMRKILPGFPRVGVWGLGFGVWGLGLQPSVASHTERHSLVPSTRHSTSLSLSLFFSHKGL